MHLGLNAMNSLVIAHALFEELTGTDVELLRKEEERSLLAASYARRFVLDRHQADLAVAGAMLHNVGHLALMSRLPAEYHATRSYAAQHGLTMEEAEKRRLGVQDSAIGAYLLGLWGLPFEVIQAVGSQHASPETLTVLDTSAVVYLAKALVAEAAPADSADLVALPDDLLSRLGVAHVVRAIREERARNQPAQGRSVS
ncbi:MAG: hypothetical protein K0R38_7526 [Polyangiaceae bacterium]|jgi:HD-like signal output (HDOD) protein|nr:hypothetical protein [Polyangiaceae bacterium]